MIKPVKRNKRLKWIDSHYAKALMLDGFFYRVGANITYNGARMKGIKTLSLSFNRSLDND